MVREHRVALLIAASLALIAGVAALVGRSSDPVAGPHARASARHSEGQQARDPRPGSAPDPAPPSPPDVPASPTAFPELGELCRRFRALRGPTTQTGRQYFWQFEWPAVTSLDVEAGRVEVARINGGFGLRSAEERLPWASDGPLAATGVPVRKVQHLAARAQEAGVLRIESWPLAIPDDYHGQPGLVVREDVAVRRGDAWWVCLDERTSLIPPGDHEPLVAALRCEPVENAEYWWRCVEEVPAAVNATPG